MKVLVLENSRGVTGAFKSILGVSKKTIRAKFIFATPSKLNHALLKRSGQESVLVPFLEIQKNWRLSLYIPMLVINLIRVVRLKNKLDIDIIHVNDLYNLIGVLMKICSPASKVVYHIRLLPGSYAAPLYRIWTKLIFRFADRIICVSEAVSKGLPKSPKKIVIYDGVDDFGVGPDFKVRQTVEFLYPANYIDGKGHFFALEAFKRIQNVHSNIRLRFVGDDLGIEANVAFKKRLEETIELWGLNEHVRLDGFEDCLWKAMTSSDVVLMFSESESFSMICAESGMNSRPVIATRCGGPEEIVVDQQTGLLVQNRSVSEMASAMSYFVENKHVFKEMGFQARERCANLFSVSRLSKELISLYQSIHSEQLTNKGTIHQV